MDSAAARSSETIDQLVAATVATIAELGLSGTTTGEVARRAGVTEGAVFHHFPSRLDLVIAAAGHVLAERVAAARAVVTVPADRGGDVLARLVQLRRLAKEPAMRVWVEVLLAARADVELRRGLAPVLASHVAEIRALAAGAPAVAHLSADDRERWADVLRNVLLGEAAVAGVVPDAEPERKFELLVELIDTLAAGRE